MSEEKNTFMLDGVAVEFNEGDTIMDAALRAGAYKPHLCHNPEFTPHGSCRVCVVGVNGRQVSACTQPAATGLDVDNGSGDITDERRAPRKHKTGLRKTREEQLTTSYTETWKHTGYKNMCTLTASKWGAFLPLSFIYTLLYVLNF